MAAGALAFKVVAETRKARADLKSMRGEFKRLKGSAAGLKGTLGGLFVGLAARKIVGDLRQTAVELDNLAKTSKRIGIASEQLAGMRFAAEQTGVEITSLDKGVRRMIVSTSEAAQGTGEARAALAELRLDARKLNDLDPAKQFRMIADAINQVKNQTDKVRLSSDIFGERNGAELLTTLDLGTKGLDAYQKELEELGGTFSGEDLAKVEKFNDSLNRLSKVTGGLKSEIVIEVAPMATEFVESLTEAVKFLRTKDFAESTGGQVAGGLWEGIKSLSGYNTNKALMGTATFENQIGAKTSIASATSKSEIEKRVAESIAREKRGEETPGRWERTDFKKLGENLFEGFKKKAGEKTGIFSALSKGIGKGESNSIFGQGIDLAGGAATQKALSQLTFGLMGKTPDMAMAAGSMEKKSIASAFQSSNSILEKGSRAAALASRAGRSRDEQKKIAENTKKANGLLAKIAKGVEVASAPVAEL